MNTTTTTKFVNEPLAELRQRSVRDSLLKALAEFDRHEPLAVPVLIAGDRRYGHELDSTDPSQPSRLVARSAVATLDEVQEAVAACKSAGPVWASEAPERRAEIVRAAASIMRQRRSDLSAMIVREVGKPWLEADADVAEAIDFLEYYAQEALFLARGRQLVQMPGERNSLIYKPRGVTAVIAPWNFPLAIATGMCAAALVTGNTVCLKPAEQSPGCAGALVEILLQAGLPAGAIALLPGFGDVGQALVEHPDVQTIAFTGSGAVGLEILRRSAVPAPGQGHLKRVISEMGGKNCLIVDSDADLDDVVPAIIYSAFGFSGQKCSAASRILVHRQIFEKLRERLVAALKTVLVGPASEFGTDVGPLIEHEAMERVEAMIARAAADGASVARADIDPELAHSGHYVAPAVIWGCDPGSEIAQSEIFGPVAVLEPVESIADACERVNSLPFALTGGLFTRDPRVIDEVIARTPVGNLYVNRATTGAMVGRQPFGGNRLSGTGTKAGGPDYLLQVVEPTVVSENTTRHGLAM